MTKKFTFLFLAIVIVFSACRKDTDITDMTTTTGELGGIPTSIMVTSGLVGIVTDEYNNTVADVAITINSNTTVTDENGIFSFSNIQMETDGALVTADKAGFFKAFDRVRATTNGTSYTRIQLLDRAIIASFPASAATDATFDGATVKFQNNSFVDANGADYTGTVNVAAHWIDPTSDDVEEQMPGDLRALDAENVYSVLETFGMVAVDLIGDNGADLQLKEGMTAEVSFPIPSELSGAAPATIPLWSFDEENGLWIEEGSATKVGNLYIGNVSHFSFWNCDAPFPLIEMNGQLVSSEGTAVPGVLVCIDFANSEGYGAGGYSNDEGFFGGKIPADEALILTVKNNCNDAVFTLNVGPFTENVDLGQIEVSALDEFLIEISGNLVDCDNNAVTNGFATVNPTSSYFPSTVEADGSFAQTIFVCDLPIDVELTGYDLDGLTQSESTTFTSVAGEPIDAGTISVCDTPIESFLEATADGEVIFFVDPNFTITTDTSTYNSISAAGGNPQNSQDSLGTEFQLNYVGSGVGTFTEIITISSFTFSQIDEIGYFCQSCNGSVTITLDEGPGGFIEGTYESEAQNFNGSAILVSGEFRIERQ